MLAILITRLYSIRLAYLLFFKPLGVKKINNLSEDYLMIMPMRLLFYAAVISGSLIIWWFIPPLLVILPVLVKLIILLLTVFLFILITKILKNLLIIERVIIVKMILFIGGIINIPILSTYLFIPVLNLGLYILKSFDQGWLEAIGGQGFIRKAIIYIGGGDKLNYLNLKVYLSLFIFLILLVVLIL